MLTGFACGGTTPPGRAQVTVFDDRIEPVELHVPAGSTVRWLNAGRRSHQIASDTDRFESFDMAPRADHDVTFNQAGRFPYAADRVLHGVIVVETAGSVEPGGDQGTGADTSNSVRHYAVALTVTSAHRSSTEGEERTFEDNRVEWTARWSDVAVEVLENGDQTRIAMAGGSAPAVSDLSASADYHHIFPVPPTDCTGQLANTYRGQLWVGGIARPGDVSIDITAGTDGAAGPSDAAFRSEYLKRCGGSSPAWPGRREFSIDSGLTFELTPEILAIRVHREHAPAMFPPVDRILARQAFTLTTGPQRESHEAPRSHDRSEWRATIEFVPR